MDGDQNEPEGLSIQDLAAQMMGMSDEDDIDFVEDDDDDFQGHPAWKDILNVVPEEHQNLVRAQLAQWDAGVSRQFQKIHDEYAPYKALEDYDPSTLKTAAEVYNALMENPKDTWETIGRVYGLSPNGALNDDEDDDEDGYELPASVRRQLSKLDEHDRILGTLAQQMQQTQAAEEEAQEDAALEEYLEGLTEQYGDFDEDYVVGLIAAGVDGEEAVARYQHLTGQRQPQPQYRNTAPNVMSGSGGIPTSGSVNVSRLNSQDTQSLITEILKLAASE